MIEFELPCCGGSARLVDLADEIRCHACGLAVTLAEEPAPEPPDGVALAAATSPAPALAA